MKYPDYKKYLRDQITRAESKWGRKWGYDEIFKQQLHLTLDDVNEYIEDSKSICCMGCRQGTEVFEFKERYPNAKVYGLDITEMLETIKTHLDVEFVLQDFNKLPLDWEDKFDLIFSNSLDHAYDPIKTLIEWHRVSMNGGKILLEFSTTPENNIEHSFKYSQAEELFPNSKFKKITAWESPERNIFTMLHEVKK